MPEITVVGQNGLMATWGWEIALYLFLGGLVAGLMVFSGGLRLARPKQFLRALFLADISSLPLLGIGMLCLFLDLSNKINIWRFYATFQVNSAMSWGAWVLLLTMVVLALRFVACIPAPSSRMVLGQRLFPNPPVNEEEAAERAKKKGSSFSAGLEWAWKLLYRIGRWTESRDRVLAFIGIILGTGVGFYTGVLLSTMPSRPLWNTAILAPLFLVSGLASGGAYLCLFLQDDEHLKLVPTSLISCGVELLLLIAYAINLRSGNGAVQRSGLVLLSGGYGWIFWGLVILVGLLIPASLETLEVMHRRLPLIPARVPPMFKLVGGLALRFAIVFAGLLSFV